MDIGSLTGQIALEDQLTNKLTTVMSSVRRFAENFDGALGAVAIGVGATAAAVAGLTISVVALGEKGSTILGVEDAFNRLAEAAGSTGEALINSLSAGVKDTVDSMELMQSVSRAMTAGVKLSADDMQLLGEAARAMGKATGTDATRGLATLSSALTTGMTRSLAMSGIVVDLTRAEDVYAASLNVTKDQLSDTEKLEAKRIAILDSTRTYVERLGVSALSFKERMQQAEVAVGNWFDSLAKSVASSPQVMQALDSIKTALDKAFGGGSQTLLEWIVKWVNRFADAVSTYAPPVIAAFGWIYDKVRAIWTAVTDAWDLVPDWLKNIARDAALAAGAVYLTTKSIGAVADAFKGSMTASTESARSVVSEWGTITSAVIDSARVFQSAAVGIAAARASIDALAVSAFLAAPPLALIGGALVAIAATAAIVTAGYQLWKLWAEDAERAASATRQLVTDGANLERLNTSMGTSFRTLDEATAAWYAHVKDLPEKVKVLTAEQERAAQAAKMHEEQVSKMFNTFAAAAAQVDVTSEAFGRLSNVQKISREAQALIIPLLDKHIAQNIALTATEASYYEQTVTSRLNQEAYNLTMLAAQKVTSEHIAALRAMGLSQAEVAQRLGTTVVALQQYEAGLNRLKVLTTEYNNLRLSETSTATETIIAGYRREAQAAIESLTTQSTTYQQEVDKILAILDLKIAKENSSWESLKKQSQEALREMAEAARRDYNLMLESGLHFTREALQVQLEKTREAEFAAAHMGQAYVSATAAATAGAKETAKSMFELEAATWAAKRAADALYGVSFDVTSENFGQALADLGHGGPEAQQLAQEGYSFAEIVAILNGGRRGPPRGPRIPGFAEGGVVMVGERGPEAVRLPFGSQVFPTGKIPSVSGGETIINNYFQVNGTAEESARKIGTIFMRSLKERRLFGKA